MMKLTCPGCFHTEDFLCHFFFLNGNGILSSEFPGDAILFLYFPHHQCNVSHSITKQKSIPIMQALPLGRKGVHFQGEDPTGLRVNLHPLWHAYMERKSYIEVGGECVEKSHRWAFHGKCACFYNYGKGNDTERAGPPARRALEHGLAEWKVSKAILQPG